MRTFQRGFFCDDLTLRYPYHECTITVPLLLILMLLMPMLFISVVEIMRICKRFRMREYGRNLWRSLATFSFGFIATYFTTEVAKNVVGRLRPHFYTACQPRMRDGSSCDDSRNQGGIYMEAYYCTNRNLSSRQISELHVSFPSAHSSLSFYSMVLLIFYLHAVWRVGSGGVSGAIGNGCCRVMRHILQFLMLLMAWYISLSRVADYWHHWSDVLAGMVLGVLYAVITAVYVGRFLHTNKLTDSNYSSSSSSSKNSCCNQYKSVGGKSSCNANKQQQQQQHCGRSNLYFAPLVAKNRTIPIENNNTTTATTTTTTTGAHCQQQQTQQQQQQQQQKEQLLHNNQETEWKLQAVVLPTQV